MTKNIFEYIKILLPKHKCVVLPKFGAFILNKEETRAFHAGSSIVPPSYSISFNSRLQHDDGVLTSYLQSGTSYEQASKELSKIISNLRKELLLNKKIVCSSMGKIELIDSSIIFRQSKDYVLPIHFGLSPVGLTSLSSISESMAIAKETKTVNLQKRWIVAAAGVAVVALLALPSTNITDIVGRGQQAGYLKSLVDAARIETEEVVEQPIIEEMQATTIEEVKQQIVVKQSSAQQLPQSSTGRTYYLVISGDTSLDIAQENLIHFREEGFETAQLLKSADRWYRVYLQAFDNMADAEKTMLKFRRDNPKYKDAWVYSTRN